MDDPKTLLRRQLRREYAASEQAIRDRADAELLTRILNFPLYQKAERIFLYASVGYEIKTHDLIHHAFSCGKTVLLPKCHSKGIMEFYEYTGILTVGKFGIQEPTGRHSISPRPDDLMFVPGLAFTAEGLRLGQGGGYYDRFMEKYPCTTVGLCRNAFLLKELPVEWNDLPVEYVITETGIYRCKNGASEEAPL